MWSTQHKRGSACTQQLSVQSLGWGEAHWALAVEAQALCSAEPYTYRRQHKPFYDSTIHKSEMNIRLPC